jgi:hypothetical protein
MRVTWSASRLRRRAGGMVGLHALETFGSLSMSRNSSMYSSIRVGFCTTPESKTPEV